jgi:GntR family transcriptional regulator, arabinose operon transcriptional repressor
MSRPRDPKPKHRRVFDTLSREILSGRYQPGEKFPSEAALVNRFKVSRITVGRAVHDLQDRGLVERFAGSGTYIAQTGGGGRQQLTFGLIIPDLGNTEIFEPICQGIAGAPDAAGHALLWPHTGHLSREQQALQLCDQCIERRVSGSFFAPLEMTPDATEINRHIVKALRKAGIPIVFLDRRPREMATRERIDLVSIDNQRAGEVATSHLIQAGAREIAFLAWHGQATSVEGRIAGYRRALEHGGHVIQLPGGAFELPATAARYDAFVCSTDRLAGHLMRALLAQGKRIPADVRIVGIDDVTYASLLPVPLTTIHQPCTEIGEAALRLLLDRIAHPKMPARDLLLDCELVVRQSCGAALIS